MCLRLPKPKRMRKNKCDRNPKLIVKQVVGANSRSEFDYGFNESQHSLRRRETPPAFAYQGFDTLSDTVRIKDVSGEDHQDGIRPLHMRYISYRLCIGQPIFCDLCSESDDDLLLPDPIVTEDALRCVECAWEIVDCFCQGCGLEHNEYDVSAHLMTIQRCYMFISRRAKTPPIQIHTPQRQLTTISSILTGRLYPVGVHL